MNKFILDIRLKKNFGLDIVIIYWDQRFLWEYNKKDNSIFDYYNTNNFELFSFGNGYIKNNEFCIPEKKSYTPNYKLSHCFNSDNDRYIFLKGLYDCLNEWGKYWNESLCKTEKIYIDNIVVNDQFWIM